MNRFITLEDSRKSEFRNRYWRDCELDATDHIVPLTDHPKHEAIMRYRQELRDYPNHPEFPNNPRPIKP